MRSSYLYRRFNHKILYISLICLNDRAVLVKLNYFPSSCVHGRHMTIKISGVTGTFCRFYLSSDISKNISKNVLLKNTLVYSTITTQKKNVFQCS